MSRKTKLIIGVLFLVQIGILIWARYDVILNRTPFEKKVAFYLEHQDTVTFIDFKKMSINYLPESMGELKNVEHVDLSFNQFTEFPKILYQLPKLKTINLGYNDLIAVRLKPNTSVTHLILEFNSIQHIQGLSDMDNLTYLNLNQNNLTFFPFFKQSQKMDTIILSNNQITGEINVKGGLIQKIGHLDLSSNNFQNPEEILSIAKYCKSLNLANNFQGSQAVFNYSVPSRLFTYPIEDLDISNCIIYKLPIIPNNNIKKLDLGYNFFKIENLDSFPALEHLNLNRMTLRNLNYSNSNLKELILTNVIIEGELNLNLPNLERLLISVKGNMLDNLPDFPNLQKLQLVFENLEDTDYEMLQQQYPNTEIIFSPSEIN